MKNVFDMLAVWLLMCRKSKGGAVVEGTSQGGDLYIDIGVPVGLSCQQLQETSWWDRNDRGSARLY